MSFAIHQGLAGRFFGIALLAGLVVIALWPGLGHPLGDKAEHILAFSVAALIVRQPAGPLSRWSWGLPLLALGAVGVELAQELLSPTRWASLSDLSASLIGAVAGFAIAGLRGRGRFRIALAGLIPFALAMNWIINVGRYRLFDWLATLA